MTATIEAGQRVPDMTLADEAGTQVRLRDLAGQTVVLYFYPADDTPGCTTQACDIRDSWTQFDGLDNVVIYGVSPDDAESHQRFRAKFDLPFHLLVDTDHKLADAFGIWGEKNNYGRKYMGIIRSTVIVDPDGSVRTIKRNVRAKAHADWLRQELGI
jgi:peroxiredoxin Q/BCP